MFVPMSPLSQGRQPGLVSVILPVLNAERFLADALASVAAQTYEPREVLIVDGHSTDKTPEIAQAFPEGKYRRQQGVGLWNAFNEGIAATQGEFIAFISADDLWMPEKIALQVAYMREHPNVKLLGARMRFRLIEGEQPPPGFRRQLLTDSYVSYMPEVILARRDLFSEIGLLDEHQVTTADIEWLGRMRTKGIAYASLEDCLLVKRIHADNLSTTSQYADSFAKDVLQMLRLRVKNMQSH